MAKKKAKKPRKKTGKPKKVVGKITKKGNSKGKTIGRYAEGDEGGPNILRHPECDDEMPCGPVKSTKKGQTKKKK